MDSVPLESIAQDLDSTFSAPKSSPARLGLLGREPFAESAMVISAILFFSGAFLSVRRMKEGYVVDVTQHDSLTFLVQTVVYLLAVPFLVRHRQALIRAARNQKLIWLLAGLAFASVLWSVKPTLTFKQSVLLLATTVFGLYFGTRFDARDQIRLMAWVMGLSIALSFALAVLAPDYGVMGFEHFGAWRGIYSHRNLLARMMVLAVLVFMMRARTTDGHRIWSYAGIAGAITLILLSGSQTGLIILILLPALALVAPVLRWQRSRLIAAVALATYIAGRLALWLLENWIDVTGFLGRDPTLTGRTYLWVLAILQALRRPWLGYGYSAFWLGLEGESATIWRALGWPAPNAHNGFLDLWLNLGLVGLSIFILVYAVAFWRALRVERFARTAESFWPLAYLTFFFMYNLNESNMFQYNSIMWVLFVATCVSLTFHSSLTQPKAQSLVRVTNN